MSLALYPSRVRSSDLLDGLTTTLLPSAPSKVLDEWIKFPVIFEPLSPHTSEVGSKTPPVSKFWVHGRWERLNPKVHEWTKERR